MASARSNMPLNDGTIDALVATYAPIGKRQKRRALLRRALLAGGSLAAGTAVALLAMSDLSLPRGEAGMSRAEALQIAADRAEIAARLAELEARIAGIQVQKQELEEQRAEFAAQSQRLALLLDQKSSEQSSLEQRQSQGSQLDAEIAALAAQRKAIEQRWAQFEAQGELLAMEIMAVNAQRKELESQRQLIQLQRQQLADMLREADDLHRSISRASGVKPGHESFTATPNSLMVDNSELDEMRGGFSIGNGMDVSFGFAQTGSINGVEQFTNSFSISSVGAGFDDIDMSNMNSVILQNGDGNFVSASVLDSLSDSFGNIIQNTLDDQVISTTTTFDISLHNMPGTLQGMAGEQALLDSLGSF